MNEVTMNTHERDSLHDVAAIDLEQLLAASISRERLLSLVKARVKLVITQFVEDLPVPAAGDTRAVADVVDYLRRASAIPLQAELCTLMARVGFDKALFTYGDADGVPIGYAEGLWLLKFIGLPEPGPATLHDTSWLQFLGKDATRH